MIDEKKIEADARRYSEVTDCDKQEALLIEEGFREGAKWYINDFLKNLWHDVFKERIPHGKRVIVEYTYEGGLHYQSIKIPDDIKWVRGFSNEKRLRRWVYVDDLFPKEGGGNESKTS